MLQKKKGNRGKITEESEVVEGVPAVEGENKDAEDKDCKNLDASGSGDSEAEKQIK